MPYLYGIADTKFEFTEQKAKVAKSSGQTRFQRHEYLAGRMKFNHDDVPIQFRATPATLVELCITVVDKLPISPVFEWDDMDIRRWIKRYGYPQYMNTFRVNMITGRKLLLLDAASLSAMNIKDFNHIRHIAHGIRMLFYLELIKHLRSDSPANVANELHKLFCTRTGRTYEKLRRSDLFRRMQLIRERPMNLDHWDILYLWLRRERDHKETELIGLVRRFKLHKCAAAPALQAAYTKDEFFCQTCVPPCDCGWTKRDTRAPRRLSCLEPLPEMQQSKWSADKDRCEDCIPPCECRWPSKYYLSGTVIKCLQDKFPDKFAPIYSKGTPAMARPSLMARWTRFSI